jgi:predicted acylesterase/phospholipase RssA
MRLGLSLSGGGFRATLFHLGVVRFLRDAGLLQKVSDIVSVSGGSILAAHLVLNWDRYNATDKDFADAASEILTFVSVDVRNRIVRRIPFQMPLRWLSGLVRRRIERGLTANGLMESELNRYLYSGRCVHELPAHPQVHILATSISEGGMCGFHREGLHLQRRSSGQPDRLEFVPAQLTPIALAVAASAAFPGFFSPVQVRAADIGAQEGQFPTQMLTDGGVYDNLGVRAFHWMKKVWAERNLTVTAADLDPRVLVALAGTTQESTPPPLRWLTAHLPEGVRALLAQSLPEPRPELLSEIAATLSNLLKHQALQQTPEFASATLEDAPAAALLARARKGGPLEAGSQAWLNRHLLASVLNQAAGAAALPVPGPGFDEILVSDAGQPFLILSDPHLGFHAQSVRATDILWDRVWQLEQDNFGKDPSIRFIPISRVVSRDEDRTALHPALQAEVPMIRTDLDRFSPLETRALVMHGYGVARAVCAHRLAEATPFVDWSAPAGVRDLPPWDPYEPAAPAAPAPQPVPPGGGPPGAQETADARQLRRSSRQRIWTTLLDWRDWPTYVYVPLLLFVFGVLPFLGWQFYQRARLHQTVVEAVAEGMPDFRKAMALLEGDPLKGWAPDPIKVVPALAPVDYKGWELTNATWILDLRGVEGRGWWVKQPPAYYAAYIMRLRKLPTYQGDGRVTLTFPHRAAHPEVRIKAPEFDPVIKSPASNPEVPGSLVHIDLNLAQLPAGESTDLEVEFVFRDVSHLKGYWIRYRPMMPTRVMSCWMLFAANHPYRNYTLTSYAVDREDIKESDEPRYKIDHPYGLVIAWSLTNPQVDRTYECKWTWE